MNAVHITMIIFFVSIILIILILNKVEKDRIPLMGDFFSKVLPKINIFGKADKKPPDDD